MLPRADMGGDGFGHRWLVVHRAPPIRDRRHRRRPMLAGAAAPGHRSGRPDGPGDDKAIVRPVRTPLAGPSAQVQPPRVSAAMGGETPEFPMGGGGRMGHHHAAGRGRGRGPATAGAPTSLAPRTLPAIGPDRRRARWRGVSSRGCARRPSAARPVPPSGSLRRVAASPRDARPRRRATWARCTTGTEDRAITAR
jgi:hypothetical protein